MSTKSGELQLEWLDGYAQLVASERRQIENLIHEHLQSMLAMLYIGSFEAMADRCLELARVSITERPSARTTKYLRRLSRVYLAGFAAETIIMCRSVLESAVADAFAEHEIPEPRNESGDSSMRMRLKSAETFGWISSVMRRTAEDVWHRGNRIVHQDPDMCKDAADVIHKTMQVINALFHD